MEATDTKTVNHPTQGRKKIKMTRAEFRKKRTTPKFREQLAATLSNHNRAKQDIKPITKRQIKEAKKQRKLEAEQRHARAMLKRNIVAEV